MRGCVPEAADAKLPAELKMLATSGDSHLWEVRIPRGLVGELTLLPFVVAVVLMVPPDAPRPLPALKDPLCLVLSSSSICKVEANGTTLKRPLLPAPSESGQSPLAKLP